MDEGANVPDPMDAFQEEETHLNGVLALIRKQLTADGTHYLEVEDEEDNDEAQTADEVADVAIEQVKRELFRKLRIAEKEPYFGRLDFHEAGKPNRERLYIGKRGIDNPGTAERMILDWRAPAASLFYSFTGQDEWISYDAPVGSIDGHVCLKRNIVVRDSELQRVVDSYVEGQEQVPATDEFLLYRLADNKDSRLRDIVSTIQSEQNEIIRADKNKVIVLQGVAGSGKTTVALHRLAYLLYQHQDRLRADKMVIFAPTAMFMDYISEVLPELGVGDIRQTTFANFALRVLDYHVGLRDQSHRLRDWFGLKDESVREAEYQDVETKGTLHFMHELEQFLRRFEYGLIPDAPFEPVDGVQLSQSTIAHWFETEYSRYPMGNRVDRVLARVKRWMEMKLKEQDVADQKALKKRANQRIKAYERLWPTLTPLDIYRDFLDSHPTLSSESIHKPKKRGARIEVQSEDLAPLLHIHVALYGIDPRDRFDHTVIDEAQDFSPFQLAVLRRYGSTGAFTILGDLSQSIHTYQGITDWSAFTGQFDHDDVLYFELDVSYRSTFEIIDFANHIIRRFPGFREAKPVFRSGEAVVVQQVEWRDRIDKAVDTLNTMRNESATVALLTRSEEDAHIYHQACLEAGLDAHLLDVRQTEYHGGVSIVPVYLAKGLEFDSVLVVDVDSRHYDDSELSAKLLYVACTRALHRLRLQFSDDLSVLVNA